MLEVKAPETEDVGKPLAKEGESYGGADGIRTHYLLTASQTLSRLSYSPTRQCSKKPQRTQTPARSLSLSR